MIKQLLKIIWSQRRINGWIFAELVLVVCAVWWMTDKLWVDLNTYFAPMGYDITNTWRFKLEKLNPRSHGYIADEQFSRPNGDDMERLVQQLKLHPEIEDVAVCFYSAPYTYANIESSIHPVDGDTTATKNRAFQARYVSPSYFNVFWIKDIYGNDITPVVTDATNPVVITYDLAQTIFHSTDIRGLRLNEGQNIAAVSQSFRCDEYKKPQESFFIVLNGTKLNEFITRQGAEKMDLCVRTKQTMSIEQMNAFLVDMGERLRVNNLNVFAVNSFADYRRQMLKKPTDLLCKDVSLTVFLLINVFFGIIGTFWLRTQHRKSEIGLRAVLGASHTRVKRDTYTEGLILLFLTVPLTLLFALNIIYIDIPDTYRMPYTFGRFIITYGFTYLLMAIMICIGIWFPVRKIKKLAPAEALHYE